MSNIEALITLKRVRCIRLEVARAELLSIKSSASQLAVERDAIQQQRDALAGELNSRLDQLLAEQGRQPLRGVDIARSYALGVSKKNALQTLSERIVEHNKRIDEIKDTLNKKIINFFNLSSKLDALEAFYNKIETELYNKDGDEEDYVIIRSEK